MQKRYFFRDDSRLTSACWCVALIGLGLYANLKHFRSIVLHFRLGTWSLFEVITLLLMVGAAPYFVISLLFFFREGLVLDRDQLEVIGFRGTVWKRVPICHVLSFRPDTPGEKVEHFRLIVDGFTLKVPVYMTGFSEFAQELKLRRYTPQELEPYPVWVDREDLASGSTSSVMTPLAVLRKQFVFLIFIGVTCLCSLIFVSFPQSLTVPALSVLLVMNSLSREFFPPQPLVSIDQLKLLEW